MVDAGSPGASGPDGFDPVAGLAAETRDWLERHDLRWDVLIMREHGDYSMARDFKEWTISEIRSHGFEIEPAFEDDERNVAVFERAGVPCVYIHSGYH